MPRTKKATAKKSETTTRTRNTAPVAALPVAEKVLKILGKLTPEAQNEVMQAVSLGVTERLAAKVNESKVSLMNAEHALSEFTKIIPGAFAPVQAAKDAVSASNGEVKDKKTPKPPVTKFD